MFDGEGDLRSLRRECRKQADTGIFHMGMNGHRVGSATEGLQWRAKVFVLDPGLARVGIYGGDIAQSKQKRWVNSFGKIFTGIEITASQSVCI